MDTSGKISGISSFQTYIGDYQLSINFDSLGGLLIDSTNSQRTVFRRKAIVKKEEIRQITGGFLDRPRELFLAFHESLLSEHQTSTIEFIQKSNSLLLKSKLLGKNFSWSVPLENYVLKPISNNDSFTVDAVTTLHPTFAKFPYPDYVRSRDGKSINWIPVASSAATATGNTSSPARAAAKRLRISVSSYYWHAFYGNDSLPEMGRLRFELRVNFHPAFAGTSVRIGLANKRQSKVRMQSLSANGGAWLLDLHTGLIAAPDVENGPRQVSLYGTTGDERHQCAFRLAYGDLLAVVYDARSRMLGFELNGFSLGLPIRLPARSSSNSTYSLWPAVEVFGNRANLSWL